MTQHENTAPAGIDLDKRAQFEELFATIHPAAATTAADLFERTFDDRRYCSFEVEYAWQTYCALARRAAEAAPAAPIDVAAANLRAARDTLDREQARAAGSNAHIEAANQYQFAVVKLAEAALAQQSATSQPEAACTHGVERFHWNSKGMVLDADGFYVHYKRSDDVSKDATPAAPVVAATMSGRDALLLAARVVELYDDASMDNASYMIDSKDCAAILTALAEYVAAPTIHAGLSQFANGEDAGQPAQAVGCIGIGHFMGDMPCPGCDACPDRAPEAAHADAMNELMADRDDFVASAHAQQAAAPAAYVNGDELDNMLDDRTATIQTNPSGWRRTPLYRASVSAVSPSDAKGKAGDRADNAGFEAWAKSHGGLPLDLADDLRTDDGLALPTYKFGRTEIAWRAWANRPGFIAKGKADAANAGGLEVQPAAALGPGGDPTYWLRHFSESPWCDRYEPLYRRASQSPATSAADAKDADSGCRMQGGICACTSGGSFGGCARERGDCCTNEPGRAAMAASRKDGQHE